MFNEDNFMFCKIIISNLKQNKNTPYARICISAFDIALVLLYMRFLSVLVVTND